ncbi:hypothetical protein [Paenibacillus hexagrammi]|uniref:Uncharacterized protein n=1 Tax=Paenibacillus hexagrammi TaxID=2908839 RepID=A0ABY3SRB9_9BACL|nr:hypothetical protein [Paenibacillus sp. YPD9-1]UJF36573.1 hypothetical protein L0M14_30765 [Paenibacillus sp. YPD9-1]
MKRFGRGTAYKEAFIDAVNELYAVGGTVEERILAVQELTDEYVDQTGERPETVQLDRLSTWILKGYDEEKKAAKK